MDKSQSLKRFSEIAQVLQEYFKLQLDIEHEEYKRLSSRVDIVILTISSASLYSLLKTEELNTYGRIASVFFVLLILMNLFFIIFRKYKSELNIYSYQVKIHSFAIIKLENKLEDKFERLTKEIYEHKKKVESDSTLSPIKKIVALRDFLQFFILSVASFLCLLCYLNA